ncbi:MAG: hypothetical protein ACXW4B_00125 [Micavibrio sp.]
MLKSIFNAAVQYGEDAWYGFHLPAVKPVDKVIDTGIFYTCAATAGAGLLVASPGLVIVGGYLGFAAINKFADQGRAIRKRLEHQPKI